MEVLGCLSNLHIEDYDYADLVQRHGLIEFIQVHSCPLSTDDDILLEIVMLIGVICNEDTAELLSNSIIVSKWYQMLNKKEVYFRLKDWYN